MYEIGTDDGNLPLAVPDYKNTASSLYNFQLHYSVFVGRAFYSAL
jgi:hypothetical protein